jgi:Spy/CpxP family protein refolding chaperone
MSLPLRDLDLSESQQEKLAELEADTRDKAGVMMVKMHSLERQYRAALMQPEISREQVAKYQSQLSQQKQALDAVFSNSMSVSAQLLTPAQRKSLRLRMTRDELGVGPGKSKGAAEQP